MKLFDTSGKRWTFGIVLVLVLGGVGLWGGRRYAVPRVKAWRAERMNNVARDFLTANDPANALLSARKVIQQSRDNVEAWRIAAAATKARDTAETLFYQNNLAQLEPTKANYLELMRLSVKYKMYPYGVEAIKNVAKNASDDPEFHSLAAQIYLHTPGRAIAAKFHLIALTQLKPSDRAAQLDLAQLEMAEDPGRKDTALRARVRVLAEENPSLRVRALSLLLRESINAKLRVETGELVSKLQGASDLTITDRLLLLEGTILLEGAPSNAVLEQLQKDTQGKPEDVVQVMAFLQRTNQHQKAIDWFGTLSEETKKNESVRRAVAEAYFVTHDWNALETLLRALPWPRREHLRWGFLAYVYKMQLRPSEAAAAWRSAVVATGNDPSTTPMKAGELLARAEEWKWIDERYDVIWKLFALMPTNQTLQQMLIKWARVQGKTADLNRIFARLVEVEPRNMMARNNLAYTSLLLDSNMARANLYAKELINMRPEDPYLATTYAFSLFKQGDAASALKQMEALTPAELSEPERMLHRAVYLAHTGNSSRAEELIKGLNLKALLPEEQKLAENAQLEIARNETTQQKTRLVQNSKAAADGGWLLLIAAETRNAASIDMRLSDTLYASADWNALQLALRASDWKTEDYLRYALLAYVYRQQEDAGQSRDAWQQALIAAGRNLGRVQNLQKLVAQWNWTAEYLETQNLVFERNPTDRMLLAELLKNYREGKRTADLIRVLNVHVLQTSGVSDEAVALAYYNLISETSLTRSYVLAKNAFEAVPDDPSRRLTYAFSLLKQRRSAEAQALLGDLKAGAVSDLVPLPLLRAAILADLGSTAEARVALAQFDSAAALPEETALAAKIAAQLAKSADAKKTN